MTGFALDFRLERRPAHGVPFRLEVAFETGSGITVVSGASGAGKTTLALALVGALRPSSGRIEVAGRALHDAENGIDLAVRERRVGLVFQDGLLFPHLDALHNACFALGGPDRRERAQRWLERVGAGDLASRRPHELSGGQRQRVALARALAATPPALVLDEPFSALDAPAREGLGDLLVELQRETDVPFLHITHDLGEALRLGSHLVLLDAGRVAQCGAPVDVLARPASASAAKAVGTDNLFAGVVLRHLPDEGLSEVEVGGTRVHVGTLDRPVGASIALGLAAQDVLLAVGPIARTSARNALVGTVRELRPSGTAIEVRVSTPASFRVLVTPGAVRDLALAPGNTVHLLIKATSFYRV